MINRRVLLCVAFAVGALAQEWKAGVATVKITPDESIWMAGYAARTKPSEGVQTDLFLKALALEDGSGRPVVLLSVDLVGLRKPVADTIADRCSKQFGLTRDRLSINTSHTHSGPMTGDFTPRPGYEAQKEVVRRYTESAAVVQQSIAVLT